MWALDWRRPALPRWRARGTAMGALTALTGADALQLTYSALVEKTTGE
ncbi:hypothetical protein [Streptomyces sp. H62]